MEVEGDNNKTKNMIGKEADKKLNKAKAKENKEKRKNSSAGGKNQPQGPTKLVRVVQKTRTTMEKKNDPH